MTELLDRARVHYRNQGIVGLLRRASRYAAFQASGKVLGRNTYTVGDRPVYFRHRSESLRHRARFFNERPLIGEVLDTLRPDDVFFDVGANTGLFTCFAATECDRVAAFEPYPPNVEALRENVALNDQGETVDVHELALSDAEGSVTLAVPPDAPPTHGTGSIDDDGEAEGVAVRTATADALVREGTLPEPSVVKIDVEGAEGMVVDGMAELLDGSVRTVFCELHLDELPDYSDSASRVEETLEDHGFTLRTIEDDGNRRFVEAT